MTTNCLATWKIIEEEVEGAIDFQKKKLYKLGTRIIPNLTTDDILQPNDFPELENHPEFRYEEGVLSGMLTMQTILRVTKNQGQEEIL